MTNTAETKARPHCRRIKKIVLLTLLGGILAAIAGFFLAGKPQYKSVGMIQIKPFVPGVFTDSGPMPMFDSYVDSQVAIIQSRRTIDMAMQSSEWKTLGRGLSDQSVADFQSSLSVSREHDIIVTISFLDLNPEAAHTAVHAVIDAYVTIYDEANTGDENRRMQILDDLKTSYMTQLARLRNAMQSDFGPASVDGTYKFKLEELNRLESNLQQTRMEIGIIDAVAQTRTSTTQPSTTTTSDSEPSNGKINLAMMRLRQSALTEQVSLLRVELKNLSNQKMQNDALSDEAENVQEQLNRTKLRIQQLTVENQIGGRISIVSNGDTSPSPDHDPRIKCTILGFIIGTALAFALALFATCPHRRAKAAPPPTA